MAQGTLESSSMPSVSAVSGAAALRVIHVTQARIQLGWPEGEGFWFCSGSDVSGFKTFSNIPKMAMGLGVGLHLMHPSDPKNVPRTDSSSSGRYK